MPRLVSVQVGLPQTYGDLTGANPSDKPWRTGFIKTPVPGPVKVTKLQIEGDGQADLKNHGGVDKAVLAYSAEAYHYWREKLGREDMQGGGFGENLTLSELTEDDVCIGDFWRFNDVVLQVSQPRQPCWKLGRRWGIPELPKLVVQTGRSGWYFRVIQEGDLAAGMETELVSRPHPNWTIAEANQAMFNRLFPVGKATQLAKLPELSVAWREDLQSRLATRLEHPSDGESTI